MNEPTPAEPAPWICATCNIPLKPAKVNIAYLGNAFPVDLMKCPQCGMVWIPEDLALGRMAEVEKTLEDK
jgi:hypothetical protein